jgi:hypothetical protein
MTQIKVKFIKNETTWDKIITDLDDNIISEELGLMLDENNNKEYFDNWENQLRNIPIFEVTEVERFI